MNEAKMRTPRLVVAGTASGVGKTTTVLALAAALRARGLSLATFKCGPDYLDPTYHARVTGRPSQNLDGWMMGHDAVLSTFGRAVAGADVSLIEGVMGLFDGASPVSEEGSTAQIAKWLEAPVLLCVDVSGMARTVGAVALGFQAFDPGLRLAGIVAIGVGSRGHLDLLREACPTVPIVGGLPHRPDLRFPERHLGLVRADTTTVPEALLDGLRDLAAEWLDVDAILALARSAPDLVAIEASPATRSPRSCRIAVADDEAFHFYYEDNLARLEAAGAELVRFSPIHDRVLPDVGGVYLGGGYPEVHARALAANGTMLDSLRSFAEAGGPVYGECGGLMYLCEAIRTLDGVTHPMAALLPGVAVMHDRLRALGYVEVRTGVDSIFGAAGLEFRGHQFRYSERVEEATSALVETRLGYRVRKRRGGAIEDEGLMRKRIVGSYVHAHWASNPHLATGFVETCATWRGRGAS